MYLCKITKREVYKNNDGKDRVVKEIVGKKGMILAATAIKWVTGEDFLSHYPNHIMTDFIVVNGFIALNPTITDSPSEEPHDVYNGRATLFNEYGQPIFIIAIDVHSVEEIK